MGDVGERRGPRVWTRFWRVVGAVTGAAALALTPATAHAAPTASLAGTVTAVGGGTLDLIVVHAYDADTHAAVGETMTDENGEYVIGGLEPGEYVLWFEDTPHNFTHAAEWYDGAYRMEDATPVSLTEGQARTGVDIELELAARACAGVFDYFDQAAVGASIYAERVDGLAAGATVEPPGWTCVENLPSGDWRVQIGGEGYVGEWYDDVATRAEAAVTSLAPGEQLDMAVVLEWSTGLSGTVTDTRGTPLAAQVTARDAGDATRTRTVTTAADGTYALPLPPGEWIVSFDAQDPAYEPQWFDGAASADEAEPVLVGTGPVTGGVDAALVGPPAFRDVQPGQVFYDEIRWLAGEGITTGFPDGTFRPLGTVSREAMAAFLHRFAGGGPSGTPTPVAFSDVGPGNPFHDDVEWLAQEGIATGWPDGTFRPAAPVERQAMAAFLYRFAGEPAFTPPATSPFVDVSPGDAFYAEICWLAAEGITTGRTTPAGLAFEPAAAVERQAMAAFLFRFAEALIPA